MQRLILKIYCEAYTGYGIMCMEIARGLQKKGFDICVRPIQYFENYGSKYPEDIKSLFVHKDQAEDYEITFDWPNGNFKSNKKVVLFTMWESTLIGKEAVDRLNATYHIIVPSDANKTWFEDSGVNVPISVVPLGIDPKLFHFRPNNIGPKFVFGCSGKMHPWLERKRMNALFPLFSRAFPTESNVELQVKTFPDDKTAPVFDTRIKLLKVCMSHEEVANLMSTWNCGVFMSSAEGWGLNQHEMQALGRPVIQAYWGGVLMHSNPEYGFPVDFGMVEAPNVLNFQGNVAGIYAKSFINQLRYVYNHPMEVIEKGLLASKFVSKFTWENSTEELIKVLKNIKVI